MEIKNIEIELLEPSEYNSRTHSDIQIAIIADSIKEFGFCNPVLIDSDNVIIAGHGRVLAAKTIDIKEVPTICLDGLSEAQKRAYIIADNRIALDGGWNEDLLKQELSFLSDENFDLSLTGFSDVELDEYLFQEEIEEEIADNVLFEQSIQLEPSQEYVVVLCSDLEEWDKLRGLLNMGQVKKGGYADDSAFNATGPQRIINASKVIEAINVDSNS